MERAPYYIIEVASTHGGDVQYVNRLLEEFSRFSGAGIKFQPFKYDMLAEEDYRGYETYKRLFFDEVQWRSIIKQANETKEVWLDLFDDYSLDILEQNFDCIKGLKIQASVLGNLTLFDRLASIDLRSKRCILNISGYDLTELKRIVTKIEGQINCNLILQAGFQSHPTKFLDSGLCKLAALAEEFPGYLLSFTDHLEHDSPDTLMLPLIASLMGASIIEKHVKCETLPTEFDHYSSVRHQQFEDLWKSSDRYEKLLQQPFINDKERQYLSSSFLVPVLKKPKRRGQILAIEDFYYRRTSKTGMNSFDIFDRGSNMYVLAEDLDEGVTIQPEHFKKARIGAAVVCRMKSKRLPKKGIIKIGKLTSVELCIKNALDFEHVDEVILATSTNPDDDVLKNHTYSPNVKFFQGSEDDVIDRFIHLANFYQLDIIIRVTGDSPYRSNEVLQMLLRSHFAKGADYTAARNAALGTNTEIINVEALKKVHQLFDGTPYSEYMSYYFKHNPEFFKLNLITLPPEYSRPYRLTLDYEEDLKLFQAIEDKFNHAENKFSALQLFDFLDQNPHLSGINKDCEVSYTPDSELMKLIVERTTYNQNAS